MKNSVLPDTSRTLNEFISSAQPLLKLITHLTDLETSFVTTIDWSTQRQRVLVAENSGVLRVETDSEFHWSNSMCQQMFSKGLTDSNEIDVQFPRSKGAKLGMVSFVVLPIVVDDQTIGTLCAADSASKTLTQQQRDSLGYIADALSLQLKLYIEAENQRHRAVIAQGKVDSLEKQVGNLSELANTDPLTGLLNRRGFEDAYTNATRLVERTAMPLSVLVLDIDDFKDFNDTYGHEMGDDVLKIVAGCMQSIARSTDITCRNGGDEFSLAALDTTSEGLEQVGERLRHEVVKHTRHLPRACTLSIGVACTQNGEPADLVRLADQALYQSKEDGRNCTNIYRDDAD